MVLLVVSKYFFVQNNVCGICKSPLCSKISHILISIVMFIASLEFLTINWVGNFKQLMNYM